MYRYILFDADNTVLDFSRSEAEALQRALQDAGLKDFDFQYHVPLYQRINREIWKEFENGKIDTEMLKTERFKRYFDKIDLAYETESISDTYLSYLSEAAYFLPGAETLLTTLASSHTLALITNGLVRVQKPRFKKAGLHRFFATVLISDELGIAKPDPAIFDLACTHLNADNKEEILMVGDNLNSDIQGGDLYGIDTCWFNPEKAPNDSSVVPSYEINTLEELYDICS